jgi:glycosyltransferase involved in cell wall biosynthesis
MLDLRNCQPCKEKMLAAMRAQAEVRPTVSIIIPSLNGHVRNQLAQTLESLRATGEADEIIVGDDCSDPPLDGARFRNPARLGMARTRHLGCKLAVGDVIGIVDDHTRVRRGDIALAAKVAWETRGFVYASPRDYPGVDLRLEHGIWRCKWGEPHDGLTFVRTTGIMGGFYFARRDLLESIGGWPALPGFALWEEEFWALYCRTAGIPVFYLPTVKHYHEWNTDHPGDARDDFPLKAFETPEDRVLVNLAAVYRLLCDDDGWVQWRQFLADGFDFDGGAGVIRVEIPEWLLAEVETPEMRAYGETIRATFPKGGFDGPNRGR